MREEPQMRRWTIAALAVAGVLLPAAPAAAHVEISPASAPVKSFGTYTLTVPNERAGQDTIGLDVTLPAGFVLGDAEQLPGWKTTVDAKSDGTATAVHWTGGRIPPKTFGRFALRGRTPDAGTALAFKAVQRYERESQAWTGAPDSNTPAPLLTVTADGATPGRAVTAPPLTAPTAGDDALARSRSSLALMLSIAALLALALVGMVAGRRFAGAAPRAEPPAAPAPAAPASPAKNRKRTTAGAR
jgi:uncharacterized protein YcnI